MQEENAWKNSLLMRFLPDQWGTLPHTVQSWLRNWAMCAVLYFVLNGVWSYYTYYVFGDKFFHNKKTCTLGEMWKQIKVGAHYSTTDQEAHTHAPSRTCKHSCATHAATVPHLSSLSTSD